MSKKQEKETANIDPGRRAFLSKGIVMLGSTALLLHFGCAPTQRKVFQFADQQEAPNFGLNKHAADFWIKILPENIIQVFSPKVEMGQGIFTTAALCAAEELYTDPKFVKVVHPSTHNGPLDPFGTGGSSSTAGLFMPVRLAAASMRLALENAAAKKWNTNAANIETRDARLHFGSQQISFADLVAESTSFKFDKKPALTARENFKYIGKDNPRTDLKDKVMGAPIFGIDHEADDLQYAVAVESPYINGQLQSADSKEAEKMTGVLQIIKEDNYLLVIADSRYHAEMAARKVKANWKVERKWDQADIDAAVQVGKGKFESIQKEGKAAAAFKDKDKGEILEVEYRTAAAAHAFMEPKGTLANYKDGKLYVVTGSQQPGRDRTDIAKALDMKKADVELQCAFLGGGFGGRFYLNKVVQAARASKLIGKPVHLVSTRESDFLNNYYRPSSHHILKAKIEDKKVVAAQHDMASDDMVFDHVPGIMKLMMGADPSTCHGALFNYNFPNRNTNSWRVDTPYVTGIWRGVGIVATSFAKEVFIDEVAEKIAQDPIDFRLQYLHNDKDHRHERLRNLIEKVKNVAGWTRQKNNQMAQGFACAMDRATVVAGICEAGIIDGKIKVSKFTLGIDPGFVVNPEGVRQQCEGCIMMGLSSAIYEKLIVKDSMVQHSNFHQYPVAMLSDTPEIEIVIQSTGDEVFGVGEPPIAPIAPAIANALYAATGKRFRSTPFRDLI